MSARLALRLDPVPARPYSLRVCRPTSTLAGRAGTVGTGAAHRRGAHRGVPQVRAVLRASAHQRRHELHPQGRRLVLGPLFVREEGREGARARVGVDRERELVGRGRQGRHEDASRRPRRPRPRRPRPRRPPRRPPPSSGRSSIDSAAAPSASSRSRYARRVVRARRPKTRRRASGSLVPSACGDPREHEVDHPPPRRGGDARQLGRPGQRIRGASVSHAAATSCSTPANVVTSAAAAPRRRVFRPASQRLAPQRAPGQRVKEPDRLHPRLDLARRRGASRRAGSIRSRMTLELELVDLAQRARESRGELRHPPARSRHRLRRRRRAPRASRASRRTCSAAARA